MLSLRTFGKDITSKVADIKHLAAASEAKPEKNEDIVTGDVPAVGLAEEAGLIAKEEVKEEALEEAMNA
jgi:hypothetical protein